MHPDLAKLANNRRVNDAASMAAIAAAALQRRYLEAIRAPDRWAAGYTGAGVQILINDDGVDNTHPDLAKLDVANSCGVYAPCTGECKDHGTITPNAGWGIDQLTRTGQTVRQSRPPTRTRPAASASRRAPLIAKANGPNAGADKLCGAMTLALAPRPAPASRRAPRYASEDSLTHNYNVNDISSNSGASTSASTSKTDDDCRRTARSNVPR